MVIGAFIEVAGCFIIGPIFPVQSSVVYTCLGMFIMGLGSALAYLPALPYMIKISDHKFPGVHS
jgi:fucose permease